MPTKILSFKEILIDTIIKNKNIGHLYLTNYHNTKYKLVDIIDDILFILKSGVSWRSLRSPIKWQSVYFHFKRFVTNNIFKQFYLSLRSQYFANSKTDVQIIDSTFIANKYGKNKIARNIFFKNKNCNKISYLTDSKGIPLSVIINSGNIHDSKFIDDHINDIFFLNKQHNNKNILLADKAYEGKDIRNSLLKNNYRLIIPPKKNTKVKYHFNKKLYKKRINIEHTFQKLKVFKRIQIRYDSNIDTYYSFVYLATSLIILNNI